MILKEFIIGDLENNNFLLIDETSKEAVLIDCTNINPEIEKTLQEDSADLKYILLTHGHFDHLMGVNYFRKKYNCKVLMHEADKNLFDEMKEITKSFFSEEIEKPHIDGYVKEGDIIKFGENEIKVIETPGHSKGGVCYLIEDKLFSGDTIFYEVVGRTDLPGGSFLELKENIEKKIFTLDEKIKIYPGHGPSSTVGWEKIHNTFL